MSFWPDGLEEFIFACIGRERAGRYSERHGTVTSYDPQNYLAKATIQPEGFETGWLQIEAPHVGNGYGILTGLNPGDQVKIAFQEGDFESGKIVQRIFSDKAQPPTVQAGEHMERTQFGSQSTPHQFFQAQDGSTLNQDKAGSNTKHDGQGNIKNTSTVSDQTVSLKVTHNASGSGAQIVDTATDGSNTNTRTNDPGAGSIVDTAQQGSNTSTITNSAPSGINLTSTQSVDASAPAISMAAGAGGMSLNGGSGGLSLSGLSGILGAIQSLGAVGSSQIENGAVGSSQIANGAVGTSQLSSSAELGTAAGGGGTQNLAASNGTTTPGAGKIGEIQTTGLTTAVSGGSAGSVANVTSLALTAGVWEIWATLYVNTNSHATTSAILAWIGNSSSSAIGLFPDINISFVQALGPSLQFSSPLGVTSVEISASTTYYLNTSVYYSGTSAAVTVQGVLSARRVA